jgi:GTP cyclohydrolase IV
VTVAEVSSVYETEPIGYAEQPDFWNFVVRVATRLEPQDLLARVKRLESDAGRRPSFRDAPRPLDIDILLYGSRRIDSAGLTVPHPRMLERRFVLEPLVEIGPELRHPVTGKAISEHLAELSVGERVVRLFPGERLR